MATQTRADLVSSISNNIADSAQNTAADVRGELEKIVESSANIEEGPEVPSPTDAGRIFAFDGLEVVGEQGVVDPSDYGSVEAAIDDAINGGNILTDGATLNGGYVIIGERLLPYDPTQVNFASNVRVYRQGQLRNVFDVTAYGAIGDNNSDEHPSFQACADHARNYAINEFGQNSNWTVFVPEPEETKYLLGDEWHLWGRSIEVAGSGIYDSIIGIHPNYDPTTSTSLVRIGKGDGMGGTNDETSSTYIHDLDVTAKSLEINALQLHVWYSNFVKNIRAVAGEYNQDNIGRETAGLHIRSGKNIFVEDCQFATQGAYGVLIDDYGDDGNNHLNSIKIQNSLITESAAGIVVNNGGADLKIIDNKIGAFSGPSGLDASGHIIYVSQALTSLRITNNKFDNGSWGVYIEPSSRIPTIVTNNLFNRIPKQGLVIAGRPKFVVVHDNTFHNCGTDHVEGSTIQEDYQATDHIADIHFELSFGSTIDIQNNVHKIDDGRTDLDRYACAIGPEEGFGLWAGDQNYHFISNNGSWNRARYYTFSKDEIRPEQLYWLDKDGKIIKNLGEESAGEGNAPSSGRWDIGDFVRNSDDDRIYLKLFDGNWRDITGGAPFIQEFDNSQVAHNKAVQIPAQTADNPEYYLISKKGTVDQDQKITATLALSEVPSSSVKPFSQLHIDFRKSGGSDRINFGLEYVRGTSNENFNFEPVVLDYDGFRWIAIKGIYDFGNPSLRLLIPHWTSNYDVSTVQQLESASVSNVVDARNETGVFIGGKEEWRERVVTHGLVESKGAIKTNGNIASPEAGMIRWTGSDFEGYNGSSWVSLTP